MDAIRKFMVKMKKVHFWILCVFLLGLGTGTWFAAAGRLKTEFKANRSNIDGMFNSLGPVKKVSPHPNAKFEIGMQELIAARQKGVLQAWQTKWDHQSQLLKWPETMPAEFLKHVNKYPVMEQIDIQKNPAQDIPFVLRENYRDFIQKELPRLAEIAGAKWRAVIEELDDSPLPASLEEVDMSVVDWNTQDQERLVGDFTWKEKQGAPIVPQTLDIYVAQENLWVLSSLMHIVKETNGGADQRHLAAIKKIDFMRVGLSAVKLDNAGKVETIRPNEVSTDAAADPMGAEPGGFGAVGGMGGVTDGLGAGVPGSGPVLNAVDPLGNRYIDEKFSPIADGTEVREAVNNPTIEKTALGVAKRLPVRLRFKMDTRKIAELLVACANAPLMLEVKQLRIARPPAPAAAADRSGTMVTTDVAPMSRGADGPPGGIPRGMDRDEIGLRPRRGMGDGPPRGIPGMGNQNQEDEAAEMLMDRSQRSFPFDDYVEVFGLVYIYNRPNEKVIKGTDDQPGSSPSGLVSN